MNNPALPIYASQNPGSYAFSNSQPGPGFGAPFDNAQTSFHPGMISNHMLRPSHPHQAQQFQQLQQPVQQQLLYQHAGQAGPSSRPESRSSYSPQSQVGPSNGTTPVALSQGPHPIPIQNHFQNATTSAQPLPPSSAPTEMNMAGNMAAQGPQNAHTSLAQQAQIQNAAQVARVAPQQSQMLHQAGGAGSPQSTARERARVTLLLEINTHLLQEVVSLQSQGKAGSAPSQGQQSPTSPTSATDPANAITNSPGEPPKSAGGSGTNQSKPPSQEYADCMRRLQANLSYLAAIADAKKKANGALPTGPAIMIPPSHMPQVHELYKKLNALFPEAGQSTINKAMAQAAVQGQNATPKPQHASAPGQG